MTKPILAPIKPPRNKSVVSSQLLEWIFSFFSPASSLDMRGDQRRSEIIHAFHGFTPDKLLENQEIVLVRTALFFTPKSE